MNAIVHGGIGVGKSTVVRAAMKRMGWTAPAGFFTHWDGRGRGAETMFYETWSGEKIPMARRIAQPVVPGGLSYALDPGFAEFAVARLAPAEGRPVVIDELGLIELASAEFTAAVAKLFRGSAPVLAVIQQRALARWLDIVGQENAAHRFETGSANRDARPAQIAALFRA